MQDYHKLVVWQKAHQCALTVYATVKTFPKEELYGLSSQIRRAGLSVPTNIAEGCGRGSGADFARCLQIAMGSACELEYLLEFARDVGYLEEKFLAQLLPNTQEVKRMLTSLINKIRNTDA